MLSLNLKQTKPEEPRQVGLGIRSWVGPSHMPVSDAELSELAASHDIITIGMQADAVRREKHGIKTTFLRVAVVDAAPGSPLTWPAAAGEVRITGVPATRVAAGARVREVAAAAKGVPVSGFVLSDLEQLAAQEK